MSQQLELKPFNSEHVIGFAEITQEKARRLVAIESNMKNGGMAWSAFINGEFVGAGGFFLDGDGRYLVWVDISEKLRERKILFHKTAIRLYDYACKQLGKNKIKAFCDTSDKRNLKWAQSFGFKLTPVVVMELG